MMCTPHGVSFLSVLEHGKQHKRLASFKGLIYEKIKGRTVCTEIREYFMI